jgi:hypothetical protein
MDQYFGNADSATTASTLLDRAKSFYNTLESNNYLSKLSQMWQAYHGAYNNSLGFGHRIEFTGEQGELVSLPVNHFRNLAQHIYVMITSNRPLMEARAVNTDYKSLAQTYLANGILDYYMREKRLEDGLKKACELSVVLGAGFLKLEWNATAGEIYDVDDETGSFNFEGELEWSTYTPFDVVVDGTKENWDDNQWVLVRGFKNRFDLAAKYPEKAEKILKLPLKTESGVYKLAQFSNDETDDIPVYEFYHKRSESVQKGRYMLFLDSDIVLLDTPLPYRVIPVFRIAPNDILGTPYGYTPMFDIFPIQEGINALFSTIMTNQNAFGVQNLYVPRGADINVSSLAGGLNIIEANAKPEPLQLTQTSEETFAFLKTLIEQAETISGVNSVARGNPESSLKSGTALALVQSMALQFVSGLQQSWVKLIESVGTSLIQILQDFSTTPKVVALVGKNQRTFLKEFTGNDVSAINRVVVDLGNPLSRTIAGRVQMAEQMMQMGVVSNPEQYFQVLNTGRLESMYEGKMTELLLIKQENEKMMDGEQVMAIAVDTHALHIDEHKAVLADPDLRKDPMLVQNTLAHIQQHIDLLRTTDPDLLMLLKQQPLNQPGMAPMQPGAPGQPGPTGDMMTPPNMQEGPVVNNAQDVNANIINNLPQMPTPPPPFENMPVQANQVISQ